MSVSSSKRGLEVRATGPGPGAGSERDPERLSIVVVRIAIVATIVLGQLWGLTVSLNAFFQRDMGTVWWLVAFQAVSFVAALVVWRLAPGDR